MTGQVKIRFSKSWRNSLKARKFEVKVNDSIIGHIASNNPELEITLPEGNHSCEVRENAYFEKKDFNLKTNQLLTLTIVPSVSPKFLLWAYIIFAIVYMVALYFIAGGNLAVFFSLFIIPIIPILMGFWKKDDSEEEIFGLKLDKDILKR